MTPDFASMQAPGQAPLDMTQQESTPQPLPGGLGTQPEPTPAPPKEKPLRALLESINIADKLDKELLVTIGKEALRGYEADRTSRAGWEDDVDAWTKLASQVKEAKTYPWAGASNVKYPLLTTAAMQFQARSYPSLLPSDGKIVKAGVIGKDPDGEKQALADRVSTYMSYQLMHQMRGWEEGMDKLLIMLPIVGTLFKKTYWDSALRLPVSEVILPKDLVVNYWAKDLESAERISHVIEMSPRILSDRVRQKLFLETEITTSATQLQDTDAPAQDDTTPFVLIEQHTYLDLDDDGYKEPYIVTFQAESGVVLRIAARYDDTTMTMDDEGELISVRPINYFTKFGFIPNPDGGFYDIGFGMLLGPINESVNTLINQLIDSGTMNSLQSGFLGKGLRLRMGEASFKPGEWKAVAGMGQDLKQQIVPLPTKEPSAVLFQLMGSLITSGKELASVAEIFVGKMPGQNTPATTTMATIEQGMKVFTSVYKRIYRSLSQEFIKLFELNATYLDPESYADIVDVTVGPDDFDSKKYKICPSADPTAVSQNEKLLKAKALVEMLPLGILDPVKVGLRMLEAQEQPNYQELLIKTVAETGALPEKQPDPKTLESQAKIEALQQGAALRAQEGQFKGQLAASDAATKNQMRAQAQDQDLRHKAMMNQVELSSRVHGERMRTAQDTAKFNQERIHKEVAHRQDMRHTNSKPSKGK